MVPQTTTALRNGEIKVTVTYKCRVFRQNHLKGHIKDWCKLRLSKNPLFDNFEDARLGESEAASMGVININPEPAIQGILEMPFEKVCNGLLHALDCNCSGRIVRQAIDRLVEKSQKNPSRHTMTFAVKVVAASKSNKPVLQVRHIHNE